MILNDRWNGADDPFEGDRELELRHLPAGALVQRARATVVPIDPTLGQDPFVETLRFPGSTGAGAGAGDWGTTRSTAASAVEVDFHARRTLAGLAGSGFAGALLAVDLGGGFMPVGASGTLVGPGQPPFLFQGDSPALPGLSVARFRLAAPGTVAVPEIAAVRVKSVPADLTLSLPGRPALWFHAGELARPETTPDFTPVLQAFLDQKATVENGFYVLPFLLHSGSLARLRVELEVEYLLRASVLPAGLREAMLPFAHDGLPRAGTARLAVHLPADARVVPAGIPSQAASRAKGNFEGTRVALGPTGDVTPAGTVDVAPGSSPAQPLAFAANAGALGALEVVALDLRLAATTRSAKLQLDLREDADGKPGAGSLLPAPVPFTLDRDAGGTTPWTSVALPDPFQFKGPRERTGWVVLQALDGEAVWSVVPAQAGARGLERTTDGGFSWRQAVLPAASPSLGPSPGPALAGLFRLRSRPATFSMPIALQVGSGAATQQVSLARFAPLARIDLSLDLPEVAQGFNQALAPAAAAACPVGELLADGAFARWNRTGHQLGQPHPLPLAQDRAFDTSRIAAGPDGRQAYVVSSLHSLQPLLFQTIDLDTETVAWQVAGGAVTDGGPAGPPVALAVRADGARAYAALAGGSVWVIDLAGRRPLGNPVSLASLPTPVPTALALSPDGSRIYLALQASSTPGAGTQMGQVVAYDTAQLEAAATGGTAPTVVASSPLAFWNPVDLAVAPDGSRVYVLVQGIANSTGQAELLALDATMGLVFDPTRAAVLSPATPKALALTPDGATAVVVQTGRGSLVDLQQLAVTASFDLDPGSAAVAVEPGGARAFFAGAKGVVSYDLARRTLDPPVPAGSVSSLAVTPQDDRILAVVAAGTEGPADPLAAAGARVQVLPLGLPLLAEWALTAGQVQRSSLGARPSFAVLGRAPDPDHRDAPAPGPNAISQVVPIAANAANAANGANASCTYELRFLGLATVADAVAELLWRGMAGGVLRTDSVPISVAPAGRTAPAAVLHRASFAAPAGATAVEVRFTAPAGLAGIAQASLRADGGALAGGDLAGGAAAWRRTPADLPVGFVLVESADGTRLRNVSPQAVTLSQRVPATAGAPFGLELRGRAVPGSASSAAVPGVELHWLAADGSETGPATLLPVTAGQFDARAAAGTVPVGTQQAEVRLVVPSGSALEVRSVDLRFPTPVELPVTFVAESPGELALLDWQVTYDRVPAPLPPVPVGGLPAPTPPAPSAGGVPGASPCPCCGDDRPPADPSPARTPAGRPVQAGLCATCGATRVTFGGPAVPGAPPVPLPLAASAAPATAFLPVPVAAAPARDVTLLSGIGKARARQLRTIGIGSLAHLAAASPIDLKQAMPGVSESTAGRFVLRARELLKGSSSPPGSPSSR